MKMLIAFGLLFSTPLYADEVVSSIYNCTHKDTSLVRQVMITHQYPGCHVTYIKADETGNKKTQQITATIRVLTLLRKLFKKSMVGFV